MSVSFNKDTKNMNIPNSFTNNGLSSNNIHFNNQHNFSSGENSNEVQGIDLLLPSDTESQHQFQNDNISLSNSSNNNSNETGINETSYEDIQSKKAFYLSEINRYSELGCKIYRVLDMSFDINEISGEYNRIKYEYESKQALGTCRLFMQAGVNFLETTDNKLNLIGDLQGFSAHTQSTINQYDEIFIELYQKYKNTISAGPEIRLLMTFGLSLTMFKASKLASRKAEEERIRQLGQTINNMQQNTNPMKGPSQSTQNALNNLGINLDDDLNFSDISSVVSEQPSKLDDINFEEITINEKPTPKKRGRKPKK
jgi:hypothetical protein